jgi:hypothetical protein
MVLATERLLHEKFPRMLVIELLQHTKVSLPQVSVLAGANLLDAELIRKLDPSA